jgi:hypothetical protein
MVAVAALATGISFALSSSEKSLAAAAGPALVADVIVARAKEACFSATTRATGFLGTRDEVMAALDVPGLKVVQVIASEVTAIFADGT